MLKTFKWLWRKAEERATERVLANIYNRLDYHKYQAKISYFQNKYEPPEEDKFDDHRMRDMWPPRLTAKEHELVADELRSLAEFLANHNSEGES